MDTKTILNDATVRMQKAVDFLEDAGYYCLDNLPVKLLSTVVSWMETNQDFSQKNLHL